MSEAVGAATEIVRLNGEAIVTTFVLVVGTFVLTAALALRK